MTWMSWQIDYLLFLQNIREATNGIFDRFFFIMSDIAVMPFTIILICIIYWGINKKAGLYIIYCYYISRFINVILKLSACIYRPWILDGRVCPAAGAIETAPGYSFPSGHTAGAVSLWGSIAFLLRKKLWAVIFCSLIIFFVMLSRNYLGVHTSQDVVVSLIIGICIIFYVDKLLLWNEENKNGQNISMSVFTLICILTIIYLYFKPYPVDYADGNILYDSTSDKYWAIADIINIFAIIFGSFLENRFIKFNPSKGSIIRKVILVVFGLWIYFKINFYTYQILSKIFEGYIPNYMVNFTEGIYITFLYPCFIKLTDFIITKIKG